MAYTTIDDPSAYFHVQLYTGSGSSGLSVTNDANAGDFQADLLWIKPRSASDNHVLFDSSRGEDRQLKANGSDAEDTHSPARITFESDGFDVDTTDGNYNGSGTTYVAWQWKANGGTTATISGGPNAVVQKEDTAKFAIGTYEGTGSQTGAEHGLGVKPDFIIIKNRDQSDSWFVWVRGGVNNNQGIYLDSSSGLATTNGFMGNEEPQITDPGIGLGTGHNTNADGENYVFYCWAGVQGYSKFGSYEGNANADGPFVYLGFKPAFVMVRHVDGTDNWALHDHKRPGYNGNDGELFPNENYSESTGTIRFDFLSNGFKVRHTGTAINANNGTVIYMAFAEHPFVSSKGVPCTAV